MTATDTEQELARVQTLLARLTMSEAQRERDLYAAARRAAADDRRSWSDHYFGIAVSNALQPVQGLIYRCLNLSERPGRQVAEDIRCAARMADAAVKHGVQVAEADPLYGDKVNAEVVRLRAYITDAAKELHTRYGADPAQRSGDGSCRCPGCELIRGMDADA